MEEMTTVKVSSAIVVDGKVVLPGKVVQVLPAQAAELVARGKAVPVDKGAAEPDADDADDGVASNKPDRARSARAR